MTRITFSSLFTLAGAHGDPAPFLAWSADERWVLAIDGNTPGLFESYRIVRISADSGEKRTLTFPPRTDAGDAASQLMLVENFL